MKVVAFNGSPRKNGNTSVLLNTLCETLHASDIDSEIVQIGGQLIRGCTACYQCKQKKNQKCVIDSDLINDCIAKLIDADAVVLGSPTYFANVTTEMKAFIDRVGVVSRANEFMLKKKVGAAVIAVRRAGAVNVLNDINHFFLANQMIIPGSTYWNLGMGGAEGTVNEDVEGLETMRVLGQNMAWLLKKLH